MDPGYPVHSHRRIFHHQRGVDLVVAKFAEKFGEKKAREAAILHITDDGLVHPDGRIPVDWDDWDWGFFRGEKDITEQALLLR